MNQKFKIAATAIL